MGGGAKVRIVAFIPSTLAEQYTALSKQSGLSRSELVRADGLRVPPVVQGCPAETEGIADYWNIVDV